MSELELYHNAMSSCSQKVRLVLAEKGLDVPLVPLAIHEENRTPEFERKNPFSTLPVLELDDGASVELGPGDTVVQNGTRHAWRNPYSEPCRMVVFLVGAERKR